MKNKWTYWRNLSIFTLCLLVVVSIGSVFVLSYQGAMMYMHPTKTVPSPDDTPARLGIPYEDIRLLTEDGVELRGWYTPTHNGAIILSAHGYPGMRSSEMVAFFARHGYGVVAWDFRALGESGGDFSTLGYYEMLDVKAALAFALLQEGVRHVGGYGQSMGAATLIRTAARETQIEALVADSAFPTLQEMLNGKIPFPILRPFIRLIAESQTGASIGAVNPLEDIHLISPRPIFIIQGTDDQVIPQDSAQRLYDAAGEPRTLWVEAGVGHVAMLTVHPEEYERRVIEFFDAALLGSK